MNIKEKLNEKYDLCSLNFTNLFHSIEIARSDFYNHAKETVYETLNGIVRRKTKRKQNMWP